MSPSAARSVAAAVVEAAATEATVVTAPAAAAVMTAVPSCTTAPPRTATSALATALAHRGQQRREKGKTVLPLPAAAETATREWKRGRLQIWDQ